VPKRSTANPELLADVARQFYWYERREKEIGDKLDPKIGQPAVARLLREARKRGVVGFDIDPKFAVIGSEDESLSRELQKRFGLKDALVIELPDDISKDDLHVALANHAGMKAVATISEGDHICVAGGRTIVQLARFIGRKHPPRSNITISPLGGRLWVGSWQIGGPDKLEYPLDADDSAFLYVAFLNEPGTRFSQISRPLFAETPREAKLLITEHCAALPGGKWNWGLKPATRAYIGVGALDAQSGHRIAEFLARTRAKNQQERPYLARIAKDLRHAMSQAMKNHLPPFGDIANRQFAAIPVLADLPDDLEALSRAYRQVLRVLTSVNERAVVMGWEHLHATPDVNVIAGSPLKVNQLWSVLMLGLLHPARRLCSELTTDNRTAQALISAHKSFGNASSGVKGWYAATLPKLFPS